MVKVLCIFPVERCHNSFLGRALELSGALHDDAGPLRIISSMKMVAKIQRFVSRDGGEVNTHDFPMLSIV